MLIIIMEILRGKIFIAIAITKKLKQPITQRIKSMILKSFGKLVTDIFSFMRQMYEAIAMNHILTKVYSIKVVKPVLLFIASFPKTLFKVNMNMEAFIKPRT